MPARYAIYLTPPADHPLWSSGCAWLGRGEDGASVEPPPPQRGVPWRYGFHATLKAPMRLAPGVGEDVLLQAVEGVARDHRPFDLPPLAVSMLGPALALRPVAPVEADHPLRRLADDCVLRLDPLRACLTPDELAHRIGKTPLDDRQQDLLRSWGYPHVLERWHWHYTLSDPLGDTQTRRGLIDEAAACFQAALARPCRCDAISVFIEPAAGAPLRLLERVPLPSEPSAPNEVRIPECGVSIPA